MIPDDVVTLKQDDGVCWFIGPDSERFVSFGVNHIEPYLWLGSYNERKTLERHGEDFTTMYDTFNPYGDDAEGWIETVVDDVSELGFRTNIRPSCTVSRRQTRWPIGGPPTRPSEVSRMTEEATGSGVESSTALSSLLAEPVERKILTVLVEKAGSERTPSQIY